MRTLSLNAFNDNPFVPRGASGTSSYTCHCEQQQCHMHSTFVHLNLGLAHRKVVGWTDCASHLR